MTYVGEASTKQAETDSVIAEVAIACVAQVEFEIEFIKALILPCLRFINIEYVSASTSTSRRVRWSAALRQDYPGLYASGRYEDFDPLCRSANPQSERRPWTVVAFPTTELLPVVAWRGNSMVLLTTTGSD